MKILYFARVRQIIGKAEEDIEHSGRHRDRRRADRLAEGPR